VTDPAKTGRTKRSGVNGPPLVSVLLPARDVEQTLVDCLESLLCQTEARWECVLVDDASQDGTRAIATAFAERDERIRVLSARGDGIVEALHTGLAACRAPLIARMDADDRMHPERLGAQRMALEAQPALAGVGCHVEMISDGSGSAGREAYGEWLASIECPADVRREAFVECPLAHPTWFLRRETFRRFPYRRGAFPEDYDLLLRLLRQGETLGVVPRRLLEWRDTPGRLSRTHPAYTEEAFARCKAEHLAAGFLAEEPQYVLWGYGATGRRLRRALAEHGRVPSHIVELHPGRLGQHIHGAPVIEPRALRGLSGRRIVTSVSGAGARTEIRAALRGMDFTELRDFVCAA